MLKIDLSLSAKDQRSWIEMNKSELGLQTDQQFHSHNAIMIANDQSPKNQQTQGIKKLMTIPNSHKLDQQSSIQRSYIDQNPERETGNFINKDESANKKLKEFEKAKKDTIVNDKKRESQAFGFGRIMTEIDKVKQKQGETDEFQSPYADSETERGSKYVKQRTTSLLYTKKMGSGSVEEKNGKWVCGDRITNPSSSKGGSINQPSISVTRQATRHGTSNTHTRKISNHNNNNHIINKDTNILNHNNNNSNNVLFNSNPNQIQLAHKDSDSNKFSFHNEDHDIDALNESFDLDEPQFQKIMRVTSNASKQIVSKSKDEGTEKNYTNGFLNLVNSNNNNNIQTSTIFSGSNKKKRASAIFVTSVGEKFGLNDFKKQQSACTSSQMVLNLQNQHQFMVQSNNFNESISPSKILFNDLGSNLRLNSEGYSPTAKKSGNHESKEHTSHNQFLNLKNVEDRTQRLSGNLCELTYLDKSQGEASSKGIKGFTKVWAKNAFLILTLIKKFITNAKQLSMKYKFSQMKKKYFDLIDDRSNDYKYYQIEGFLKKDQPTGIQKCIYGVRKFFNKNFIYLDKENTNTFKICLSMSLRQQIGVILPDSFFKILWDSFILFLLTINVFYIPLKIAFSDLNGLSGFLLIFFEDIPSWGFVADIILNFNTAYYSKGVINQSRIRIAKHYIRTALAWDLIIVIPFLFSSLLTVRYLNIILLLRSSKILKIANSIEELVNFRQSQATIMSLVKLILIIIYIAHICGCFFYYMHVVQTLYDSSAQTWVVKFHIDDDGWFSAYISSLYWSVITMITLGYGDLYPITMIEKIYVIIVTLLSCGVFAYAVNSIGQIIQEMTKKGDEFRSKMSSLTSHMRSRNLSNVMQMRVRKYFQYLHNEQQEDNEDGQQVLGQCTSSLKNEVLTEMYSQVLQSKKEFRLNFSKEFLVKLAPKLREKRLGPEEIIFNESDYSRKVHFLMRGNIALQRRRNNGEEKQKDINIKILKKGDIVGLESFLSGSQNNVSAKTLNVVSLVYLRDEDFQQVISDFPVDKEKYAMIKDKLNLQNSYRGLGINCYLCDSYMHQFLNCPYMSYQPNQKKVIQRALKDHTQERAVFLRSRLHQTKTIHYAQVIQENAIKYLIENNPYNTLNELLEKIQQLEEEEALNIDVPEVLARHIKDPQEFEDLVELNDEDDINEYLRSPGDSSSNNQGYEDSVKIRRATIGSSRGYQEVNSIGFGKLNSLRMNKGSSSNLQQIESSNMLDAPKRNEERKNSFRKSTVFSDKGKMYHNQKKLRKTGSLDSQKQSENINATPIITHNIPNSTQLDKKKDKITGYRLNSKQQLRSLRDDDDSGDKNTPIMHPQGSQMSNYYLDNMKTLSVKSKAVESRNESKHEFDGGRVQSHYILYGSQAEQVSEFMLLPDFDKERSWEEYFPENNLKIVLIHYSKILNKRQIDQKKKKRKAYKTHSQKFKHMQQIFSSIQARNQSKTGSNKYLRNHQSKASIVTRRESSINPMQIGQLNASEVPNSREPSKSNFSMVEYDNLHSFIGHSQNIKGEI